KKRRDICLLNPGELRINIRHHRVDRGGKNGAEETLGIFLQHAGKFVDAGEIKRLVEGAADGVGHTEERADIAVERVVDDVQHLDLRQLEIQILREIEIHLAGRELLEAAVHINDRQFDFRVLKSGEAV